VAIHPESQFDDVKAKVTAGLEQAFPVQGSKKNLVAKNIQIQDTKQLGDFQGQLDAKNMGKTWAVPITADLQLVDRASGRVLDTKYGAKIADLPRITDRYSYVVKGNEYQVDNIWRRKPGVYSRIKENGELQAEFNLAKGKNFEIVFNPKNRKFNIGYGTSTIPLYPVLKAMGVPEETLQKRWGKEILEANRVSNELGALRKFSKVLGGELTDSADEATSRIAATFNGTALSPEITEITLGRPYDKVNAGTLYHSANKLLSISRGDVKPDDRDALQFKTLHNLGDLLQERIEKGGRRIAWKIRNNLDRRSDINDIYSTQMYSGLIQKQFTEDSLAQLPEQNNPIDDINGALRVTILGTGGIGSEMQVIGSAKAVDPSHLGFMDTIYTPEGRRAGVVSHLALGIDKEGVTPKTRVYDLKKKKYTSVDAPTMAKSKVIMPDQVVWESGRPKAKSRKSKALVYSADFDEVPIGQADYVFPANSALFGMGTNLVPFLGNNSANRISMAARTMSQAIALKDREAPLVRAQAAPGMSWDKVMGEGSAVHAKTAGTVTAVKGDEIIIRTAKGKKVRQPLYDNFPLNQDGNFYNHEPVVKKGDTVKKGELLADLNFTKDGILAIGKNMYVGFLSIPGKTFEDGIVVSDSAAQKMTSDHMYRFNLGAGEEILKSRNKFRAYFPTAYTRTQLSEVDDDGVVEPGRTLQPGDPIMLGLTKKPISLEGKAMARLHKSLVKPYSDVSQRWEKDVPGKVVSVVKGSKETKVYVRALEPAKEGDKLVGRHGNKGIISAVVPDQEMPHDAQGRPLDVVLNPYGVPGRQNIGQIYELATGKIAEKQGKPMLVPNFGTDNAHKWVKEELKKHDLSEQEDVYDPKTGKHLGKVMAGPLYLTKLKHMVEEKFKARAGGPGYPYDVNRSPGRGGPFGAQGLGPLETYALLGHGAKAILREAHTYKSDMESQDELWRALQLGEPLPPPKIPYVYNKFEGYLKSLGVDTVKKGNTLQLQPVTDKQVREMAVGRVTNPLTFRAKDMRPEPGGLFDPAATKGLEGDAWSYYALPESFPNPLFEKSIQGVTGLTKSELRDIVAGDKSIAQPKLAAAGLTGGWQVMGPDEGLSGGAAIKTLLDSVNVDQEVGEMEARLPRLGGQLLDKAHRKLRYLKALQNTGLKPSEAYMTKNVPIMPPMMRPVMVLPSGDLSIDNMNELYRGVIISGNSLKDAKRMLPDEQQRDLRRELYDGLTALSGITSKKRTQGDDYSGALKLLHGEELKRGFFQGKVIKRRQDLSARSTIVPNPSLGLDEVGVPKKMAMTVYKPFVVRELHSMGYSPLQAQEQIKQDTSLANTALAKAVEKRPVLLKRDPVLHKYGIMAFKPKLVGGKAVQVHPLITGPYGADFDGDDELNQVLALIPESVYGADIEHWRLREVQMSARFKETVGFVEGDGRFIVCDLSEFPHDALRAKKGHIEFYGVPKGTKVIAIDEKSGEAVLADVDGWSLHRQREVEIVTLGSGRQIITDDDERAVYGLDSSSLEWCRRRPSEAENQFIPVLDAIPSSEYEVESLPLPRDPMERLKEEAELSSENGYWWGLMVGDGWGDVAKANLACSYPEVAEAWKSALLTMFEEMPVVGEQFSAKDKLPGSKGSTKYVVSSEALARFVKAIIGSGAENKHLPPFFLSAPRDFKMGLLAGLWDSDGSVSWSQAKKKPQFLCNYTSISLRLVQEIQHLLRTLSTSSTITTTVTPKGEKSWILNVSIVDYYRLGGLPLINETKRKIQSDFLAGTAPDDSMAYSRYRLVPLPAALGKELRRWVPYKKYWSEYTMLGHSIKREYISKKLGQRVVEIVGDSCGHPLYRKWRRLVETLGTHFERVKKVEKTGIKEDGYDLTVPGHETFMSVDGIVLSNTMAVYTPISNEAVREAWDMMPSKNLFSPSTGRIAFAPTNETVLGLYKLTETGRGRAKSYDSFGDVIKALDAKTILPNQPVVVEGRRTTAGRALLFAELPAAAKDEKILTDPDLRFDSKGVNKFLYEVGKKSPEHYSDVARTLMDLGNQEVYERAHSYSLEDFSPDAATRNKYMAPIASQFGKLKPESMVKKLQAADKQMAAEHKRKFWGKPNNLQVMVQAGVKPNWIQYKQMIMTPVMMEDARGNPIPNPVTRSWAEGVDTTGMLMQSMGARASIIKKTQEVTDPGALTKRVVNTVMDTLASEDDCGTKDGIPLAVEHPDFVDRYLAKSAGGISKGTLITPGVIQTLKKKGVRRAVVRSPSTCEIANGVCSTCFGLGEHGHKPSKGTNLGVLAGQAIGERSTQLMLKAVHMTGAMGAAGGAMNEFDRVQQLLTMPRRIPNAATIAEDSGKITKIRKDPAGGYNVEVSGRRHYIPQHLGLLAGLKNGSTVKKGQRISGGQINVHDLLSVTGIHGVREQISDELDSIYGPEGVRRRNVELLARDVTNLSQVMDPGDNTDIIRGDYMPISAADAYNAKESTKKPIKYVPILKGVNELPHAMSEDWLARLNHTKVKDTIIEAANQGWVSNLHSTHPIPALARGYEFGKMPFGY
jgi:DNA-directed RNA polymerase beta subunit